MEHAIYRVRKVTEEFERDAREHFRKFFNWNRGTRVKIVEDNKDPFTDHVGVVISFSRKMVQIKPDEGSVIRWSKNKVVMIDWP